MTVRRELCGRSADPARNRASALPGRHRAEGYLPRFRGRPLGASVVSKASSAYEQASRKRGMFHGATIEQRRETTGIVDRARGAAARGVNHCRLKIPENARRLRLSQRQQALARRNQTRDPLVKKGEHGTIFFDSDHAAHQAEGRAVMNHNRPNFERLAKKRKIIQRDHRLKKIAAQRSASRAALSRGLSCAQTLIEFDPALGRRTSERSGSQGCKPRGRRRLPPGLPLRDSHRGKCGRSATCKTPLDTRDSSPNECASVPIGMALSARCRSRSSASSATCGFTAQSSSRSMEVSQS